MRAHDVPLWVAASCKPPRITPLPFTYQPVSDNVLDIINYDFAAEQRALEDADRHAQELAVLEERIKALAEDRKERKLAETRAKAPGFSGDASILQPTVSSKVGGGAISTLGKMMADMLDIKAVGTAAAFKTEKSNDLNREMTASPKPAAAIMAPTTNAPAVKGSNAINFKEFETGLAPKDPWDTVTNKDDFHELREVMDPESLKSRPTNGGGGGQPQQQQHIHQQQQPQHHQYQQHQQALQPPSHSPEHQSQYQHPSTYPHTAPPPTDYRMQSYSTPSYQTPASQPPPHQPTPPPKPPNPYVGETLSYPSLTQQSTQPPAPPTPAPPETIPTGIPPGMEDHFKSFASMGFSSTSVKSAVIKFGQDNSKYLDYLVAISQYESEGHTIPDIEKALQFCKDDFEKTKGYLGDFGALCELGFAKEDVHDALSLCKDRDAALEQLMGGT
ncbi:hypothetical protein HDV05_003635 [Chytridiales sp. JEL 0842]|nr:hypothetical protein HDV05_003635 [Chytridiales sp. JEL 0842]